MEREEFPDVYQSVDFIVTFPQMLRSIGYAYPANPNKRRGMNLLSNKTRKYDDNNIKEI